MSKNIILFTLQTFSTTGGIQKMTRTLAYALNQVATNNNWDFKLWSAYDANTDLLPQYLPAKNFRGFANRITFTLKAFLKAPKFDIVVISHINMALVGRAIKTINPKCKIWVMAHGIEIWNDLSSNKKWLLKNCNKVICVSNFTKQQIINKHHIDVAKCEVLNNALDPFMNLPAAFAKPGYLIDRYNLTANTPLLFTLTRLNAAEQYKGYEQVIKIIGNLKQTFPAIKYIISGKCDDDEKDRINKLIKTYNVEEQVLLTEFVEENELVDHFLMADLFVLPSSNEGFGIVFIEALACGVPVVCGNIDGSVDAIKNGLLGRAVNPNNLKELENALNEGLQKPLTEAERKVLQSQCIKYFNTNNYIKNLNDLLINELAN
jgi:phosphatidyl-myo-inositol dimannoside synthase